MIEKLFLIEYKEREYFQHQCDSVEVKCENQIVMNIFTHHFPRPGGVKSYHMVLKFRD